MFSKNKIVSLNEVLFNKAVCFTFLMFCFLSFSTNTGLAGDLKQDFLKTLKEGGPERGQQFLIQKINDGEIEAVHILATILIKKKNIKGNLSLAVEVLERGTELGDPKSSYLLGNYFSDGNYIKADYPKAKYYYELAGELGHPKAKLALSKLPSIEAPKLQKPDGVTKNIPRKNRPIPEAVSPPRSDKKQYSVPPGYNPKQVTWSSDELEFNRITSTGSGFAITTDGLIVTNEHVINNCSEIFVIYQGKPKMARVIAADKKADFAALKIKGNTPTHFYFKKSNPELGEELISGGFPSPQNFGFGIKITTGIVSSELSDRNPLFQHTTPTQPGNSGGPLLNNSGILVGVSTAVSTVKWGDLSAQNVNYAVSNVTAKSLLNKWGLPYKTLNNTLDFDLKLLAKHLKKAAAQIICY